MSLTTISLSDFRNLRDRGCPLNVIDVRTPAEFSRVHASGARSIPLDELDPLATAAQRGDAKDPIYVICQSGARAAKAIQSFQDAGVPNVYSIEGGTAAWEKMGLPVERGRSKVISLERQVRIGAGFLVLLGVVLATIVRPAFLSIPALVGAGLMFAGITDYCGMAIVLGKMPWNR